MTYSLKEVLTEVRINKVPEMKVGQQSRTDVSVPADAEYSLESAYWMVWNDAAGAYEPFNGVFEYGKAYDFRVEVKADSGYRFSETETTLYANGVAQRDSVIFGDYAAYMKEYATGLKTLDRVELKVDEPIDGQPASVKPVVSVVGGSGFEVVEDSCQWLVVDSRGLPIGHVFGGYLRSDEAYGVNLELRAAPGYVFAEDLEVVVNGTVLPESMVGPGLKSRMATYVFGAGDDQGAGSGGSGQGGIAQAGDGAMGLAVGADAAAVVAGLVCAVAYVRRRRAS